MHNTKSSLSQQAYEQIRQQIISLALPPGGVIDETVLREDLGLGRTPIREALQRLAKERLVVILPRRGMFVSDIGITDLQRLFEVRLVMETLAARLAAERGTEAHWAEMREAVAEMRRLADMGDNQALITIDERCHRIIYEACDNSFLRDSLYTLYALSLRLWYFALPKIGSMRAALEEHEAIADALEAHDGERAAALLEDHIHAFQDEIQSVMLGETHTGRQQVHDR